MVAERRRGPASDAFVSVRLTHKYAEAIDGVDLSHANVGDYLHVSSREASLLISEGWAVACFDRGEGPGRGILTLRPWTIQESAATGGREAFSGENRPRSEFAPGPSSVYGSEQDPGLGRWFQRPPAQITP
jgi:hypothetical protein